MRKGLTTLLLIMLLSPLLLSCWRIEEDWSLCGVEDNLTLLFGLKGGNEEAFYNQIKGVELFLYGENDQLLLKKSILESDLQHFMGARLTLRPGSYKVVCWANVDENSRFILPDGGSEMGECCIELASERGGSPLYYAPAEQPFTFHKASSDGEGGLSLPKLKATVGEFNPTLYQVEIPPNTKVEKEMLFRKVHRSVEVYIVDYRETSLYDGKAPIVEQAYAGGRFSFLLSADLTPRTLKQSGNWGEVDGKELYSSIFHSALIPLTSEMEVNIYHPTSESLLAKINLEKYVADNNIVDDSLIPILVAFNLDASVSITVPSWRENIIVPGL